MKILGISGNLRTGSYNTTLLEIARQLAPAGTEMTVAIYRILLPITRMFINRGFHLLSQFFESRLQLPIAY